jgi:hypothetical protein
MALLQLGPNLNLHVTITFCSESIEVRLPNFAQNMCGLFSLAVENAVSSNNFLQ